MTKQVIWTKHVLEAFIKEANLNPRQEYIIRTRAQGYRIAKQADELHLSIDQVNKEIALLKKIYDITQEHSKILPKRVKKKSELKKWLQKYYIFITLIVIYILHFCDYKLWDNKRIERVYDAQIKLV